jgi:hypothetical protein
MPTFAKRSKDGFAAAAEQSGLGGTHREVLFAGPSRLRSTSHVQFAHHVVREMWRDRARGTALSGATLFGHFHEEHEADMRAWLSRQPAKSSTSLPFPSRSSCARVEIRRDSSVGRAGLS